MFIQELKGSWIDHPFWKKAFKLEDPSDLQKLQASVIKEVIIDTSKGLDIAKQDEEVNLPTSPVVEPLTEVESVSVPLLKSMSISAAEEQAQAKKVINASKKAFVKSVDIYPIGSMVKLKSGRLAVVIDQSSKSLLSPIIKVFFSTKSK